MNPTYILIGVLGVLFHSFIKANTLAKDAEVSNIKFNPWTGYVLKDYLAIGASLLSVFIWNFIFDEVAASYPRIATFVKVSFFVMGFMGSYLLQLLLSKAKKQIRAVIDEKTTAADGTSKPVTEL